MIRVYLYKNLHFLRKQKGWIQAEMQQHCGITGSTWSNYENGKTEPDLQTLAHISKVFEVSLDDLVLKNLEDVQVNEKKEDSKNWENVRGNVRPTVQVKEEIEGDSGVIKQDTELPVWAILGHLSHLKEQVKEISEKIDRIAGSGENSPQK